MFSTYLVHDRIRRRWDMGPVIADGRMIRRDDAEKYAFARRQLFQDLREKTGFNPSLIISNAGLVSLDEQTASELIVALQKSQNENVGFNLDGGVLTINL